MNYSAEISVTKDMPAALLFLIDQSSSMSDAWAKDGRPKSEAVAVIVNKLLDTTILRCQKGGGVRDYFHLGVIGYGPNGEARFAFSGNLAGRELVVPSELKTNAQFRPVKYDAGDGTLRTKEVPTWFDPVADNGTPMAEALNLGEKTLRKWCSDYPSSYPPIVFNITDGAPNDPEAAESAANSLKSLSTTDGNVLLYNFHLSGQEGSEIMFPQDDLHLSDEFARFMFRMSSVLPESVVKAAEKEGMSVTQSSKGLIYNGNSVKLIEFLDIGTRPMNTNLR